MSGFRFRLDKVKRLRDAAEKEATWALARALAEVRESEASLKAVRRQRATVLEDLEQRLADNGIDLPVIQIHHGEVDKLDEAERTGQAALGAAEVRFEQAQAEVRDRRVDSRALETLESRAREVFERELQHREAQRMDEVAAARHRSK